MRASRGWVSIAALVGLGMLLPTSGLMGQKREDFIALQRDVAQLQDQIKQMQSEQDQKFQALQTLLQQAVDASVKNGAAMSALQDNIRKSLAEEQQRSAAPLANLNNKVNQVSEDVGSIKENVSDLQ